MYFLVGLLIFNMLVLGANFCFLLVGGHPFRKGKEFAPVQTGNRTFSVERFAIGVSTSVLGVSWLVAWIYFLITGWDSFIAQLNILLPHVIFQFLSSVALIFAGLSIFKQWKKNKGIFLISIAILIGSIGYALIEYEARGHGTSIFMYLFGMWTFGVGVVLTTATYLLDRLMHDWDENLQKNK